MNSEIDFRDLEHKRFRVTEDDLCPACNHPVYLHGFYQFLNTSRDAKEYYLSFWYDGLALTCSAGFSSGRVDKRETGMFCYCSHFSLEMCDG